MIFVVPGAVAAPGEATYAALSLLFCSSFSLLQHLSLLRSSACWRGTGLGESGSNARLTVTSRAVAHACALCCAACGWANSHARSLAIGALIAGSTSRA